MRNWRAKASLRGGPKTHIIASVANCEGAKSLALAERDHLALLLGRDTAADHRVDHQTQIRERAGVVRQHRLENVAFDNYTTKLCGVRKRKVGYVRTKARN